MSAPAASAEFTPQAQAPDTLPVQAQLPHVDDQPRPATAPAPEAQAETVRDQAPPPPLPLPALAAAPEASPFEEAVRGVAEERLERKPEAPARVARRAVPDLPPVTLELPPESGLVLVETSHRAEAAPEAEPPLPAGPHRARRPRAQLAEEPLQIVETRKDATPPN